MDTSKIVILDGGMGTMLQAMNFKVDKVPEVINITDSDIIIDIHKQYINAGSQIIYANTFGVNSYKVNGCKYSVDELIKAGIKNARMAVNGTDVKVALSVGPIGELLEPNGVLAFEAAYDIYKEIVIAGKTADLVVFETMTDLLEVKAAILATKENTDLPIFCTMTFEENGRTFTGVTVEAMAVCLQGLSIDAIGINCSLGPTEILPLAKRLREATYLPIIVKANAGLPNLYTNGYDISADEFANTMEKYLDIGVNIIGGCCGTTPKYIENIVNLVKNKTAKVYPYVSRSVISSGSKVVNIDSVTIIGERLNPTGKKRLKEALLNEDYGYILTQALEQVDAGAEILDVNVGVPLVDEGHLMVEVIKQLQAIIDVPLQIDSTNPIVIEKALRVYNGKPIVNSINGEQAVLEAVLPLIKKYGAAVLGLTLDESGIKNSAEERFKVAEKIVNTAISYGIKREDIYIDCLTLTASVQQAEVLETLKAIHMVKSKLGVKTILGVSNISFGLPNRELINTSFLTLAMSYGLDMPIMNPNNVAMVGAVFAFNVLYNIDSGSSNYIARYNSTKVEVLSSDVSIEYAIENGIKEYAKVACEKLILQEEPLDIVNKHLIPALDRVGIKFERGEIFLPQLIQSATAAKVCFEVIKDTLKSSESTNNGTIVVATVKGDVHDIGKNIVKVVLENYGYKVIDLGKDVAIERVVEAVQKHKPKLVGLSALMTTTIPAMAQTIEALRPMNVKVMVGGAVLTGEYATKIGADYYAKDAKQSVDIAKIIYNK